ncbi:MAG: chromosome segregation protein SMC, partial [Bdellovibrionales bacterium]|nr:chromosome segregation protein SMC [Bdellovibrionales bacterium]
QAYESQKDSLRVQTEEAMAALEDVQAKVKEFERHANRVNAEFEGSKQMSLMALQDVENLSQNKDMLFERVKEKRQEVESFKDEFNAVTSRLYGLENLHANFEGFQDGVKSVMMWKKQRQVVRADGSVEMASELRPISDVVSIPEEFELAMEAALGTRLQMLLSENGEESLQAVDYLKEQKAGRSSFFNVDGIQTLNIDTTPTGDNVVLLKSVVSSPEKYSKTVNHLIGNVAVVDSIRTALSMRSECKGWTFVTREGDTLTSDGVLTGGTAESAGSGILKRGREIKDLVQQKEEWSGKLALASVALKKMESQLENIDSELEKALKTQAEQEIRAAELRKDMERADNELKNARAAVDKQVQEKAKLDSKENELTQKVEEIQLKLSEMQEQKQGLESSSQELEADLQNLRLGIDDLQRKATEAKVASAEKRQ